MSLTAGTTLAQDPPTGMTKSGTVTLLRTQSKISLGTATVETTMDIFAGGFLMIDWTNYPPLPPATTIGPCVVINQTPLAGPMGATTTGLDAGPFMNLNGPNGIKQFAAIKNPTNIAYGGSLGGGVSLPIPGVPPPTPLYLDPGTYTVDNGAGGADIGPFTATLTLPSPPFAWTNADASLSIDRSAGVDIQWTGGDPGGKVIIQGVSSSNASGTDQTMGIGSFVCTVDNTGDFFVSPDVLSLLPATNSAASARALNTLSVSSVIQTSFDAAGSDVSTFAFRSGASRNVVYQ